MICFKRFMLQKKHISREVGKREGLADIWLCLFMGFLNNRKYIEWKPCPLIPNCNQTICTNAFSSLICAGLVFSCITVLSVFAFVCVVLYITNVTTNCDCWKPYNLNLLLKRTSYCLSCCDETSHWINRSAYRICTVLMLVNLFFHFLPFLLSFWLFSSVLTNSFRIYPVYVLLSFIHLLIMSH